MLNVDTGKLSQILNNLLSNAIKFTREGKVLVSVSYENNRLSISVTDTGIGIPPEKVNLIFEQFEQADTSTTRHFGGTGLGLPITKGLVELLQGELIVQSEVGKGTSFQLVIPASVDDKDICTPAKSSQTSTLALPPGLRVLLAEDNDINAEIVLDMLKAAKVKCIRTRNGEEAVNAERKYDFDVILMDCQMPVMDGFAAAQAIRRDGRNKDRLIIIALTANVFTEDKNACLAAGMNAHLSKPIRKQVLFDCISSELARI